MAIRLQEVHPALVHLPIGMLPVAVGADLLGRVMGDETLLETGRRGIGIAAISELIAGVTGLVAQEEVSVEGESLDMLITHRNLNFFATLATGAMAMWRWRREEPSVGYLGLGLAGIGVLVYTAYLGGKMVYQHGVGVEAADGLYDKDAPELRRGQLKKVARTSARDLAHAVPSMVKDIVHGNVAPRLTRHDGRSHRAPARAGAGVR
ncbi:MAG TPA: DUF2231 domain-containing protein [Gemmatimonadaceae bacterium]|nr:DUF2231 domain-containing protein [Gemmatimonadaceae bacterium]